MIDQTYKQAKQMLEQRRDDLDRLAQNLLRYETLSYDEVDRLMSGKALDKPTVGDLIDAEKMKTAAKPKPPTQPTSSPLDDAGPGVIPSPA